MTAFDDIMARWVAGLPPHLPRAAVEQFVAEERAALSAMFEQARADRKAARAAKRAKTFTRWLETQAVLGRDFDDVQLGWLGTMRDEIAASRKALTLDHLRHGAFAMRGGLDAATRVFGRRTLGDVVASLNTALAGVKSCGCGGACGACKRPGAVPHAHEDPADEHGADEQDEALARAVDLLLATLPRPKLAALREHTRRHKVPRGALAVLPLDPDEAATEAPEHRYALALHLPDGRGLMFRLDNHALPTAADFGANGITYPWGNVDDPDTEAVILARGLTWSGIAYLLDLDVAAIRPQGAKEGL